MWVCRRNVRFGQRCICPCCLTHWRQSQAFAVAATLTCSVLLSVVFVVDELAVAEDCVRRCAPEGANGGRDGARDDDELVLTVGCNGGDVADDVALGGEAYVTGATCPAPLHFEAYGPGARLLEPLYGCGKGGFRTVAAAHPCQDWCHCESC